MWRFKLFYLIYYSIKNTSFERYNVQTLWFHTDSLHLSLVLFALAAHANPDYPIRYSQPTYLVDLWGLLLQGNTTAAELPRPWEALSESQPKGSPGDVKVWPKNWYWRMATAAEAQDDRSNEIPGTDDANVMNTSSMNSHSLC